MMRPIVQCAIGQVPAHKNVHAHLTPQHVASL